MATGRRWVYRLALLPPPPPPPPSISYPRRTPPTPSPPTPSPPTPFPHSLRTTLAFSPVIGTMCSDDPLTPLPGSPPAAETPHSSDYNTCCRSILIKHMDAGWLCKSQCHNAFTALITVFNGFIGYFLYIIIF